MSYPESQEIREVRFVSMCASPGFWGTTLLLIGAVGLLPDDLSRYVWPIFAIAAGAWLLFGPLQDYREQPRSRYEEPADRF